MNRFLLVLAWIVAVALWTQRGQWWGIGVAGVFTVLHLTWERR